MEMIGHDRVGQAVNGEGGGEKLQSITNPLPAMFERLPGQGILAAQEGSSHAAVDEMQNLHFVRIDIFSASLTRHPLVLAVRAAE
jgi:hypothetical protein